MMSALGGKADIRKCGGDILLRNHFRHRPFALTHKARTRYVLCCQRPAISREAEDESNSFHEFGGPEVLQLEDVPTPKPAAGQVLVRIHAAGVNPYDTYMRAGAYARKPGLPYTSGSDGAGV